MYEFFEHTADLGLRVRAGDLNELFRDAARGLFAMIAEESPGDEPAVGRRFEIAGRRRDHLLLDWLNELLFVFETERLLLRDFEVEVSAQGLVASALARPMDLTRDRMHHEVKAITYHGLRVEASDRGWLAEVIVDI
jgi:SHS2 domain-containing protein